MAANVELRAGAPTVLVATILSAAAAAADVGARAFDFEAQPAQVSLHLQALVALLAASVLLHRAMIREGRPRHRSLPLLLSIVGFAAVIASRLATSVSAPTVAALVPFVAVAPTALSFESWAVLRKRPGAAITPAAVGCASCAAGATGVIGLALEPANWMFADIRRTAVVALLVGIVAIAIGVGLLELARRRDLSVTRFASIAAVGALALLGSEGDVRSGLMTTATLAIVVISAVPSRTARSVAVRTDRCFRSIRWPRWSLPTPSAHTRSRFRRQLGSLQARIGKALMPMAPKARSVATRGDRIGAGAMAVGSLAYVASGLVWASRIGWQPTGHAATEMARAYDVGTVNHPFSGMATGLGERGGAYHPGPIVIDLLAPLVRTLGVQNGARVGAVVVVLTCWAVAVWTAWRAHGRAAAVGAWVTSALILAIPAFGAVWDANNITISTLAMFSAVVASWAAAAGSWKAWWWAVGLGSLTAQSYLPHGLVIIGPVLWSGMVLVAAKRRADPGGASQIRSALRVGWAVGLLIWSQPLLDIVIHRGGNPLTLLQQVGDPKPSVGLAGVSRGVAWIFSIPPRWGSLAKTFAEPGTARGFLAAPILPALVVVLLLGLLWSRTAATTPLAERQLRMVTLFVVLGGVVNTALLPRDDLRSYQLGWLVVASMFVWFTVALSVGLAFQRRLEVGRFPSWVPVLRVGGFAGAALLVLAAGLARPDRIEDVKGKPFAIDAMVGPVVDQTLRNLDQRGPFLALTMDSQLNDVAKDSIMANLIVHGVRFRIEQIDAHYGDRRIVGQWGGPMLLFTSALPPVDPAGRRLATGSVPGWSRTRFDALARDVAERAAHGPPLRLTSSALIQLPRYLSGWVSGDVCAMVEHIRAGRYPVASLPPGLLLTLYGDLAIEAPSLPESMSEEARDLLGQGPIEVWEVDRPVAGGTSSSAQLRNGLRCPPPRSTMPQGER